MIFCKAHITTRLAIAVTAFAILSATAVSAQTPDTSQAILDPAFRSLQVTVPGDPFAPPVVMLGDDDSHITIAFDELTEERRYMRYELIHCDARWRPEGLVTSEFLDGFNEGSIEDYDYSRATLVHYVHYSVTIPNKDIRITATGNYMVRIYDESNPDATLLRARFSVSDFSAEMLPSVSSLTDIDANRRHQQVSLTADLRHVADLSDPYSEITLTVSQNGRNDNEVILTTPQRVGGSKVYYEHLRPLIFPAGNEYRRFETVSTTYPGMGVERITYHHPVYHMDLYADAPRAFSPYSYDSTQHGRFFVREADSPDDSDTAADYVTVYFSLEMPELSGADIFIDGDMTQRRFDPSSRMVYNHATGRYEQSLILKQGAYNYQYLTVPSGSMRGQTAPVEGDFHQTVNEYTIRMYHRPRGARYDRLIGVTRINSGI